MNLKKSPGQTGVQASQSVVGSMKVVPSLIFGKISCKFSLVILDPRNVVSENSGTLATNGKFTIVFNMLELFARRMKLVWPQVSFHVKECTCKM